MDGVAHEHIYWYKITRSIFQNDIDNVSTTDRNDKVLNSDINDCIL